MGSQDFSIKARRRAMVSFKLGLLALRDTDACSAARQIEVSRTGALQKMRQKQAQVGYRSRAFAHPCRLREFKFSLRRAQLCCQPYLGSSTYGYLHIKTGQGAAQRFGSAVLDTK